MADINILKRIYLLKAAAATSNGNPAAQVAWLQSQLIGSNTPGDNLTAGGWVIKNQAAGGRSVQLEMLATDEERSTALLRAIDSFGLTDDDLSVILSPNFMTFRP